MDEIRIKLGELLPILRGKYHVRRIGIFGSYARGDQSPASDVDLLVDFSQTVDLFQFAELKLFLSKKLKKNVDLVTRDAVKKQLKKRIFSEAVFL